MLTTPAASTAKPSATKMLTSHATKNSTKAMLLANFGRTLIDIAALGSVFLLRNVLPGNFEATIAGTAASLGLLTVFFAFRLARPDQKAEKKDP